MARREPSVDLARETAVADRRPRLCDTSGMTQTPSPVVGAAHPLEPTDGPLRPEELQLAFRNRGLPLEALHYDVTPTGLHYLVVHWDIPPVDPASWQLAVGGRVRAPLELTLDDIRRRPRRTIPVTLECAGNGRSWLQPRPLSIPWLGEAIGTAEWTGTPLSELLGDVGLLDDATEIVFRGADRGIQGDEEQTYARSLAVTDAVRPEVVLAYEMNGQPPQPQHGFPLRLVVPGWYGMTSVKWLTSIEAVSEPFDGFQQATAYRYQQDADDPGEPVQRMRVRALMAPPGIPTSSPAAASSTAGASRSPAVPGRVTGPSIGSRSEWTAAGPTQRSASRSGPTPGGGGRSTGRRRAASTSSRAVRPTPPVRRSRSRLPGTTRGWATTSSSASLSPFEDDPDRARAGLPRAR